MKNRLFDYLSSIAIPVVATEPISTGDVVSIGELRGIAVNSAAIGETATIEIGGVFEIVKETASDVFNQGALVHVNANGQAVTSPTEPVLGFAHTTSESGDSSVKVKLAKGGEAIPYDLFPYVNGNSDTTPIVPVLDTWTAITNDNLSPATENGFLPDDLPDFYNPVTGVYDFSNFGRGSEIRMRVSLFVEQTNNNTSTEVRANFGFFSITSGVRAVPRDVGVFKQIDYEFSFYIGNGSLSLFLEFITDKNVQFYSSQTYLSIKRNK